MAPDTRARKQLREWMSEHPERTQTYIAKRVRVSQPTVYGWLTREQRPEPHRREVLELVTGGRVRAVDWMTASELRLVRTAQALATGTHDG